MLRGVVGVRAVAVRASSLDQGLSALQSGDYEQAVVLLERARQEEPENVGIALHLASAYDKAGDPRRAVSAYESAESLLNDPDQSVSMRRHRERFAILKGQVGE